MRLLIAALALIPTLANGQALLDSVVADLNGDGISDRADLVQNGPEYDATLDIYVGRTGGGGTLAVQAPDLVWAGSAMAGQTPELQVTDRGSLQVISRNEAIGRDRWIQTLTIAFRQGRFKLAGYTYSWYDTLNVSNNGTCDINLLNGRGEIALGEEQAKTAFRTDLRAMPIEDWSGDIPPACLKAINSVSGS